MRIRTSILTAAALIAFTAPTLQATPLAQLIASPTVIRQCGLVFTGFRTSAATDATTVDVTPFSSGGESGLRIAAIPAGSRFSAVTSGNGSGGAGAREVVIDLTFGVSAAVPITAVRQTIDPSTAATGNALIQNLTTFITGPLDRSLNSCFAGDALPPGQNCTNPHDFSQLPAGITGFTIERQIQLIVGQKGGSSGAGDASVGDFEVSFTGPPCAPAKRRIVSH